MSTGREFVDDREPAPRVPADAPIREIAPDDFVARSPAQTFYEALRAAARETSRTPDQLPRCPECLSVDLKRKAMSTNTPSTVKGAYKCRACEIHFDEAAPSVEAARDTEQVTLPGVRE
jgi:ribosomal protein L37AE/L43A